MFFVAVGLVSGTVAAVGAAGIGVKVYLEHRANKENSEVMDDPDWFDELADDEKSFVPFNDLSSQI